MTIWKYYNVNETKTFMAEIGGYGLGIIPAVMMNWKSYMEERVYEIGLEGE